MRPRPILTLMCLLAACAAAHASSTAGWPGLRGPNSDGAVPDARLFDGDAAALKVGWKVALGSGYSAPVVEGDRAFAMYADGDADYLAAFDVESGERAWRYRIGDTYKGHDGSHDGPIATPVISGGRVFGLGAWGQLFAVDAATGEQVWVTHLADDLGAEKPWYGFASSPRVADGVLVVELSQMPREEAEDAEEPTEDERPEPKPMAIAGIDVDSGKARWILGDDYIEYQSAVVATLGGRRQVLAAGKKNLYGIDPQGGEVLWSYGHDGDERAMGGLSIVPLVVGDDRVFLTNKIDSSVMLRVAREGDSWNVEPLWSNGSIARSYVVPVYHDGYLYGMNNRIFACVDAATGELAWRSREPGDGFPTVVGDHIVMITKAGSLHVIDATPAGYHEVTRLDLFEDNSWSEVAYAGGHLFARSMGQLARIDVDTAGSMAPDGLPPWLAGTVLGRFLAELDRAADKPAAIDAFLAAHPVSPIVEDDGTAHFVYRGPAEDVGIVGDLIGFRREDPMIRVPGTDFFHYSLRVEPTAAATYGFIVDYGEPAADPRNPRTAKGLFGDVSWFAMPAWEPASWTEPVPRKRQGRLESFEWISPLTEDETRTAQVYLPAGYDRGQRRYPVAYVHAGKQALEQGAMKDALDHLIGSRVAPLIAVFVHARGDDPRAESRNENYPKIVLEELVPRIDERYRTIPEPQARASIGAGSMGSVAVELGFAHPESFTRVAAQSPFLDTSSFPDLDERNADARPLVVYLDWGSYHMRSPHEAWSLVDEMRKVWDALHRAGYRPAGGERPEGYAWPIWTAHADELLATMFPLERAR